jgi:hypothetical protein
LGNVRLKAEVSQSVFAGIIINVRTGCILRILTEEKMPAAPWLHNSHGAAGYFCKSLFAKAQSAFY